MATVEQSIIALNLQLSEAYAQIGMMSLALDTLRNDSAAAVQDLRRQLAEARVVEKNTKDVNFINTKVFEGGKYTGYKRRSKRKGRDRPQAAKLGVCGGGKRQA